jgi:hypothetical protein
MISQVLEVRFTIAMFCVVPRQNSIRTQKGPEIPSRRQLLKELLTGEGLVG